MGKGSRIYVHSIGRQICHKLSNWPTLNFLAYYAALYSLPNERIYFDNVKLLLQLCENCFTSPCGPNWMCVCSTSSFTAGDLEWSRIGCFCCIVKTGVLLTCLLFLTDPSLSMNRFNLCKFSFLPTGSPFFRDLITLPKLSSCTCFKYLFLCHF